MKENSSKSGLGSIVKLGFDEWFQEKMNPSMSSFNPARVITVNRNNYVVSNGEHEILAEPSGKFLFEAESSLDYPAVGDWVYVQLFDDEQFAVIHEVLPRKTLLKRKTPGKKVDYQLIASNIDTALIIQALDSNYNLRRLERYLVMVNESNIQPAVLLSKSDLLPEEEIEKRKADIIKLMPECIVTAFSNFNEKEIGKLKELFTPQKTYCLLGSSGVGKTTLLNNLLHGEIYKTQEIREKDGRGRHTTTRRELTILDNGAIIIDNPGMRELGVISAEEGLNETFNEISHLAAECRFDDCTHTAEKGCAVLGAVEEGKITKERYDNYIKMYKESLYNEMSYVEKRQRDKQFGKIMHNYLKNDMKDKWRS
ncbi:MAG: ribosome small subunit-dependent GTPase A [archaeon]